jgi:hypothetical protein
MLRCPSQQEVTCTNRAELIEVWTVIVGGTCSFSRERVESSLIDRNYGHLRWFKSSRSNIGEDCVEVAVTEEGTMLVRDSKAPHADALRFTRTEWNDFIGTVKSGQLDAPSSG